MADAIPILTLHALDARKSPISFPPHVFRRGLTRLAERGFRTIRLQDVPDHLEAGESLPDRAIVLTFDDGYRSVYDEAFPVLEELGMTATVFLTIGDGDRGDDGGEAPADDVRLPSMEGREMLSWGEIRSMAKAGIDLGGHTLTHPFLPSLPDDVLEREVRACQTRIEAAANVPVESFAYPDGRFDRKCRDMVRSFYRCACGTKLGRTTLASDPWSLERIEAYYFRTDRTFSLLGSSALPLYLRLRAVPRAVRRAAQLTLGRGGRLRRAEGPGNERGTGHEKQS